MLRSAARAGRRLPAAFLFLLAVAAAGCGASPSAAPTGATTPSATAASSPSVSGPAASGSASPAGLATPSATPHPSAAPTPTAFWAAVSRGLTTAKHLAVTIAGPNPGVLRFEPAASATIVGGKVVFVCVHGIAYDGQLGFARVPGSWQCGAAALVSGFRRIGQPSDSWSASSPRDSSISEAATHGPGGTWTWTYFGISPFLGGRVTARLSLDAASGRILAGQRTDPTGTTTYSFDYISTFPALAVPAR
jgi:hypothetical protein